MEVSAMTDVLVTGGTGFIGAALVKALLKRGDRVRVFDNNIRGSSGNLGTDLENVDLVLGDIRNLVDISRATEGINTVFHLAYINGTENFYKHPDLVLDVGVRGTLNAIDAAHKNGVSNFIYASSSEVYQLPDIIPSPETVPAIIPDVNNPRYSYGGGKLAGELLSLHYAPQSMRRIIFRPHNIYGPAMGWEHVIPQLVRKIGEASEGFQKTEAEISIQGTGQETRAFCYIEDAIAGILVSEQKGKDSQLYHVGKQEEISIADLVDHIADVLNIKVRISSVPIMKGSTPRRCPDISKLSELGFRPKWTLQHGLLETVDWYKKQIINE